MTDTDAGGEPMKDERTDDGYDREWIESLEAICRKAGLDEQSAQLKARAWTDRIVRSFDHD